MLLYLSKRSNCYSKNVFRNVFTLKKKSVWRDCLYSYIMHSYISTKYLGLLFIIDRYKSNTGIKIKQKLQKLQEDGIYVPTYDCLVSDTFGSVMMTKQMY